MAFRLEAENEYQNALGVLTDLDNAEIQILDLRKVLCRAELGGSAVEYAVALEDVMASLRRDRARWEHIVRANEARGTVVDHLACGYGVR